MAGPRFERLRTRLARLRPRRRRRPDDGPPAVRGYERPPLGDLHETRRQSLGRRLRGLRDRRPRVRRPRLGGVRDRLAEIGRGAVGAVVALGDAVRDGFAIVGGAIADAWFGLSLLARQRIAAAVALLAAVAFGFFVLVPLAPCWVPGGDRCPPPDDAVALVPADVAAYVHANLDAETDQFESAAELAGKLPELRASASSLLSLAADRAIDYERDVRPWSGGELAVVLDADGLEISRMLMFEVADEAGALDFARRILGPGVSSSEVDGTSVDSDRDGLSAAILDGFLLIGPDQLVRAAIELDPGDALPADPAADAARDALPDDALLDAYLSADFAATLGRRRDLGPFDTFVDSDASEGVAAALGFDSEGVDLAVRSIQDPERAEAAPDFFSALPLFEPELTERVNSDALVYLGVGDPGESAGTLVGQAAATAPDLFDGLKSFNRRLRRGGGVDIERDVLPLLEGEAALTVEPQEPPGEDEAGQPSPGVIGDTDIPYLALLATGVDAEEAARDLAELQVPIAESVDPSAGQAPVFGSREIGGVTAQSLRLSPVVDLTYATFDDELIVGTSPAAVERAVGDGEPLADGEIYERVTSGFPDQVSIILYLDFRDLLSFGERLFLAEDPAYARFAGDLRTLEAAALAVTRTRTELATDLRVTVGEPQTAEQSSPTLELEPE